MNSIIRDFYVDNGTLPKEFTIDTTPKTILKELTKTGIDYTWETVRDERIDNIQSVIEVRVYLPSNVLYGRHVYKTADASDAHLYAISEAIKLIVVEDKKEKPTNIDLEKTKKIETLMSQPTLKPIEQPVTQEEILAMIQQNDNTKITTAEQYNSDVREQIPFDDIELEPEELDKVLFGKTYTPSPQPVVSHGFTQAQINAMNEFKQKMSITNDSLLCSYINSWNNKLSKKEDLTPENIDAFIEWTKALGKAPC